MAAKCDPIRTQLQALEQQLKMTEKYLDQPAPGLTEPSNLNPEWVNLDGHVRRTRMSLQACEGTD